MMGLPVHHCQPEAQPLGVGLGSETEGDALGQRNKTKKDNHNGTLQRGNRRKGGRKLSWFSFYLLAAEGDFATITAFL